MLIYIANYRRFYKKNLGQGKKKESTKFQKIAIALKVLEKERNQLKKHVKVSGIQLELLQ